VAHGRVAASQSGETLQTPYSPGLGFATALGFLLRLGVLCCVIFGSGKRPRTRAVENRKPVLFKRKKTNHKSRFFLNASPRREPPPTRVSLIFFLFRTAFPGNTALQVLLATRRGRQWGLTYDQSSSSSAARSSAVHSRQPAESVGRRE
jgi:hypothetical protein